MFFDMNGIVHNAGRRGKDEGHVFVRTFQEIDRMFQFEGGGSKSCGPPGWAGNVP